MDANGAWGEEARKILSHVVYYQSQSFGIYQTTPSTIAISSWNPHQRGSRIQQYPSLATIPSPNLPPLTTNNPASPPSRARARDNSTATLWPPHVRVSRSSALYSLGSWGSYWAACSLASPSTSSSIACEPVSVWHVSHDWSNPWYPMLDCCSEPTIRFGRLGLMTSAWH